MVLADNQSVDVTIEYSMDMTFTFVLQWNQLSDEDASSIWNCWLVNAVGYMYSFGWQHPMDGHIYVVKFDSDIKRLFHPGTKREIPEVRLRVKGYIS